MIGTQGRNTTWSQFVNSYSVRYSSSGIIFSSIFDASLKEKVEHSFKRTLLSRDHFINGNRCVIVNDRVRYFGNLFFKKMNFSIGFGVISSFKIWKIQGGGVLSEIPLVVAGGMNIFWNHTFGKNFFQGLYCNRIWFPFLVKLLEIIFPWNIWVSPSKVVWSSPKVNYTFVICANMKTNEMQTRDLSWAKTWYLHT